MAKIETLADRFLDLWLVLNADEAAFRAALDWQERDSALTLAWANELDDLLADSDWTNPAALDNWGTRASATSLTPTPIQRALVMAQAIDRWHQPLSAPVSPPFSHARARRQLYGHSRLNDDGSRGRVILRRPVWGRYADPKMAVPDGGRGPWDTFTTLFVIPPTIEASDPDDRKKKRTISFSYRLFDAAELRLPTSPENWKPKVGFVPLAEQPNDLQLHPLEDSDGHWYDAKAEDLGQRAAKAIEALCGADAEIIVFPEVVIHADAVAAIKEAVKQHGPPSQLRLVVAGTRSPNGAAKPFNEAIVLDHRGGEIGRQRKLHRWNLDEELRQRYAVPITLPSGAYVREYITPGEEVMVLDTPFGRLAVMICEDLGRSEPGNWVRKHMLLDWLFTPILDSSIGADRWMAQVGKAALLERCRVVIANSVLLTHQLNAANKAAGGKRAPLVECGIGICLDLEAGQARYRLENHKLSAPADAHYLIDWEPLEWPVFS